MAGVEAPFASGGDELVMAALLLGAPAEVVIALLEDADKPRTTGSRIERPLIPDCRIDVRRVYGVGGDAIRDLRFTVDEIFLLVDALGLPATIITRNRVAVCRIAQRLVSSWLTLAAHTGTGIRHRQSRRSFLYCAASRFPFALRRSSKILGAALRPFRT